MRFYLKAKTWGKRAHISLHLVHSETTSKYPHWQPRFVEGNICITSPCKGWLDLSENLIYISNIDEKLDIDTNRAINFWNFKHPYQDVLNCYPIFEINIQNFGCFNKHKCWISEPKKFRISEDFWDGIRKSSDVIFIRSETDFGVLSPPCK